MMLESQDLEKRFEEEIEKHAKELGIRKIADAIKAEGINDALASTKSSASMASLESGGGIIDELVYEPIGGRAYLWNDNGKRGASVAKYDEKKEKWIIEINEKTFDFIGNPIKKTVFYVPSNESISNWLKEEYNVPKIETIIKYLDIYLKTCFDIQVPQDYDILKILILESWATPFLEAIIYGMIIAGYGSGKTALLEAISLVMKHGFSAGNISPSALCRITSSQKLSLTCDEVDAKKESEDSELYMTIRQGYRRNNLFVRVNPKTMEIHISEPFGMKVFSLHSDIERATKTRGLPINLGETDDHRLPIINLTKECFGKKIYDNLYFWYMTNIAQKNIKEDLEKYDINLTEFDGEGINEEFIKGLRQKIFDHATQNFSGNEKGLFKRYRGRNIELLFICMKVSKIFGVDLTESLVKSFDEKVESESEFDENIFLTSLKEILIDGYNANKDGSERITKNNLVFETQKTVYQKYNEKLKSLSVELYVSNYKFAGLLREFGFIDKVNKKKYELTENGKEKSVRCLFFDNRVLNKLGLATLSQLAGISALSEFSTSTKRQGNNTDSVDLEDSENRSGVEK